MSTVLVAIGLWLARLPLAEFMIGAALAERGAEADFQVNNLDFNGLTLANVRFGAETSPDAAIPYVEARWRWNGLVPELVAVRLTEPRLRLRLNQGGQVSAGSLDRLGGGPPGTRRPTLPHIALEIIDGRLLIEAPFGALEGAFRADGTLGEDFTAVGRIPVTTRPGDRYALDSGGAELVLVSRDETAAFRLSAEANGVTWDGANAESSRLTLLGRASLDLSRFDVEAAWRIASLDSENIDATLLNGAISAEGVTRDDALEIADWEGQARANARAISLNDVTMRGARFTANGEGVGARGRARWSLGGDRFEGIGLISQQPAAAGRLQLGEDGALSGDALLTMARSSLNAAAQADLRAAFPELGGTPLGPTFAQARNALDAAADSFTFTAPLLLASDSEGARLFMVAPAEARANTGARLRLSPLRQDAPALVLQWPGPRLHGSVALELSGGGAPSASLLFDAITSSAEAPFEADGTITLANWRVDTASIAADELGVTVSIPPGGGGRIDLRGPARVTGPLGDGEVRDLVATLDLRIAWNQGWRVTSNSGCLPVAMGGLDAAGLSFANGNFSLCSLDGALIAADASNNLSGGFSIRALALDGRMAGPEAQPARLAAGNVVGRFSGRPGNMTLALTADAPSLTITMSEDRTLAIALQRVTANAQIADGWRVDGAFVQGELSDPSLPGSVATIEGDWSTAPEDGEPVIRVHAAEAVLVANRPASDAERTLFNPMRLFNVDAILRDGVVNANGDIMLAEPSHELAQFVAQHTIDAGAGWARVTADNLVFSPDLQPYHITEQTRGLVDNVTGSASAVADISWTRDTLVSGARVRLNNVSLATSTIPIVEHVNGEIVFDDLFALTTPPGQNLTVGVLNPGVAVTNGRVRFQLLSEQRVAIERAEFAFASGLLSMQPTTITLGAEETSFELTLSDVDAADLLSTLKIPDLTATGRLEGSFPLLLTRRTALVDGGIVRAQGEGGTIAYTGPAGSDATGYARIAFDALRSFRYDSLSLTLDGDLNGEVISSIEFSGENSGRPIDMGSVAPIPGLGNVRVRGVPFNFNVRVTAPFSRLAQTAATITDPGSLLDQRRNEEAEEEVDPEAAAPE